MSISNVRVRLLDLGWLYANSNDFLGFIEILDDSKSNDIYATEFVKTLLDVFWNENENKILWKIFVPYILYLAITLCYMVHIVNEHTREEQGYWFYLGIINMINVSFQIFVEFSQVKQDRWEYITNPMNVLDCFQYFSVFFLVFITLCDFKIID